MPRIGSFGPSIQIKYKLESTHVIRVAVNKLVSGKQNSPTFASPRRVDRILTCINLKTRQDERQGMELPLEAIAFYSDSFVARKINVEQKVAENWAWPRTGPHTVHCCNSRIIL